MSNQLHAIADRIKKINDMNGWAITKENLADPVHMGMKVALIASEGVEVINELEKAYTSGVSLGDALHAVVTEFADVIIRALHISYEIGVVPLDVPSDPRGRRDPSAIQLARMRERVMAKIIEPSFALFEMMRKSAVNDMNRMNITYMLGEIVHDAWMLAESAEPSLNMYDVINAKLDVNEKRGHKHGGKAF